MKKLITKVVRIFDRTNALLFALAGILIVAMMCLVLVDVSFRLKGTPIMGMIEVIRIGLIYLTFLGAAHVLKMGGHIRMDLVLTYLKPRTQDLINATTSILGTIIWLALTFYSAWSTLDSFQFNFFIPGILRITKYSLLLIIPVGSFLLFIQSLRQTYGYLKSFMRPTGEVAPGEEAIQTTRTVD